MSCKRSHLLYLWKKRTFLKSLSITLFQEIQDSFNSISKPLSIVCSISASCPASLIPASLPILLKETFLTALVDSGSSESYINSKMFSKLGLDVYPTTHQAQMVSTAMTSNQRASLYLTQALKNMLSKRATKHFRKSLQRCYSWTRFSDPTSKFGY